MTDDLFTGFATRIRNRERAIGYWCVLEAPGATERIARIGYDYVVLDGQHGLLGYSGILQGLMAIDAGASAVGLVRVEANNATPIGRALDAGAGGVIVPLIDTAADAAAAVSAGWLPSTWPPWASGRLPGQSVIVQHQPHPAGEQGSEHPVRELRHDVGWGQSREGDAITHTVTVPT